jgi:hypothetical protein
MKEAHRCLPFWRPSHGRRNSMPHAHARLRSAIPFRRAMVYRAELLALLAARFRRIRRLSNREDAKHQRGYSKDSKRHGTLLGGCKNPISSLHRCGVSRRHAGAAPVSRVETRFRCRASMAQPRSTRRHRGVKENLSVDEALSGCVKPLTQAFFCHWYAPGNNAKIAWSVMAMDRCPN